MRRIKAISNASLRSSRSISGFYIVALIRFVEILSKKLNLGASSLLSLEIGISASSIDLPILSSLFIGNSPSLCKNLPKTFNIRFFMSSNTKVDTIFSSVYLLSLPSRRDKSILTIPPINSSNDSVISVLSLTNPRLPRPLKSLKF